MAEPASIDRRHFIQEELLHAVEHNHMKAVEYLVTEMDCNIFQIYPQHANRTLLHIACLRGFLELAAYLLELGMDVNAVDKEKHSIFYRACCLNNLELVEFLVKAGANLNYGPKNISPMGTAISKNSVDVVTYLLNNVGHANLRYDLYAALRDVVTAKNVPLIELLLHQTDVDVNTPIDGQSLLHFACATGSLDIIQMILTIGANVDAVDTNGDTPMFRAPCRNFGEILAVLFHNKANLLHINKSGNTPLHIFARDSYFDNNVSGFNGMELLLANGLDVNHKNVNGDTALHMACRYTHSSTIQIVQFLINAGGNIHLLNNNGDSLMHVVAHHYRNFDIFAFLMLEHLDVNLRNNLGKTPIMNSVGDWFAFSQMIGSGANIWCTDNDGRTLLHYCVDQGSLPAVETLFNCGYTDATSVDHRGQTALHLAAKKNNFECFRYLVNHYETDLTIRDKNGKIAESLTRDKEIREFLQQLDSAKKAKFV